MENRNNQKETIHKFRRFVGRRQILVSIALMLALAAVGVLVVFLLSRAELVDIKEPVYQYVFSEPEVYESGISMKKNQDGILIDNGYQQYETNGFPFYFEDKKEMILTDTFLYMDRDATIRGKVEYFTTITETGSGYELDDPKGLTLSGGMLHDGEDVYIFLEDTTLTFNGKTVDISGLSYVVCFRGQSILVCQYGASTAIYEELNENGASAIMANGIKIDLANDTYYKQNGTKHLLFATPDAFDEIQ